MTSIAKTIDLADSEHVGTRARLQQIVQAAPGHGLMRAIVRTVPEQHIYGQTVAVAEGGKLNIYKEDLVNILTAAAQRKAIDHF